MEEVRSQSSYRVRQSKIEALYRSAGLDFALLSLELASLSEKCDGVK